MGVVAVRQCSQGDVREHEDRYDDHGQCVSVGFTTNLSARLRRLQPVPDASDDCRERRDGAGDEHEGGGTEEVVRPLLSLPRDRDDV